ncbi:MAG: hypothetical protein IJL87_03415 [Clostridia bacterium]|nr:hypothetical protein [Clostridia bacterium]
MPNEDKINLQIKISFPEGCDCKLFFDQKEVPPAEDNLSSKSYNIETSYGNHKIKIVNRLAKNSFYGKLGKVRFPMFLTANYSNKMINHLCAFSEFLACHSYECEFLLKRNGRMAVSLSKQETKNFLNVKSYCIDSKIDSSSNISVLSEKKCNGWGKAEKTRFFLRRFVLFLFIYGIYASCLSYFISDAYQNLSEITVKGMTGKEELLFLLIPLLLIVVIKFIIYSVRLISDWKKI